MKISLISVWVFVALQLGFALCQLFAPVTMLYALVPSALTISALVSSQLAAVVTLQERRIKQLEQSAGPG